MLWLGPCVDGRAGRVGEGYDVVSGESCGSGRETGETKVAVGGSKGLEEMEGISGVGQGLGKWRNKLWG